ncbi:MAG: ATP-dependent DNA helicase RecG [Bacteroidetes bacterium]|nr:MAG: ATP-dependent DNA helicase RecG [Bacteroidota bacterium]
MRHILPDSPQVFRPHSSHCCSFTARACPEGHGPPFHQQNANFTEKGAPVQQYLAQDIQFLPGVGPKRAQLLKQELGIACIEDLLNHYPFRYVDRSRMYKINELRPDMPYIQVQGKIEGYLMAGQGRGKRLTAVLSDETGRLQLVWFKGAKWIPEQFPAGKEVVVFGRPSVFRQRINLVHPEMDDPGKRKAEGAKLQAVYSTTEKLKDQYFSSKAISKLMAYVIRNLPSKFEESLPAWLLRSLKLVTLDTAIRHIHFPNSIAEYKAAELRLKFEELFYIQLHILKGKSDRNKHYRGNVFKVVGNCFNAFYQQHLPFELTAAQKRVIREIRQDMKAGIQMNRLLQGDVGSGKTLVALLSMLIAADNGFQSCLMAPTEILAQQHFRSICHFLTKMDIRVELLTGSVKKKDRIPIHEGLENGDVQILIGTHAVIEDTVKFRQLGLVVIDEQHRFGVAQRARLWGKADVLPHVLVMTATPIPRTLAMTLYGDLDVSVIDELPPGRKAIVTRHTFDSKRLEVFGFLKKQLDTGRQAYIVYPLIHESEAMDYKDLEDGLESISRAFPPPQYQIAVLHGKMKPEEKEASMQHFLAGRCQIMVATTVIEVGVDVPNASIMIIESAERFGLSQLHQLRGRVGRGSEQSYCILMSGYKLSEEGRSRLNTMVRTNDGFEIAEADLKLRGPGDIEGTQQSGVPFNLKIAHLGRDSQILQLARNTAESILDEDPLLELDKNFIFRKHIKKGNPQRIDWGSIS